jgi:Zinc finger, C3HC4 type (RING finger)
MPLLPMGNDSDQTLQSRLNKVREIQERAKQFAQRFQNNEEEEQFEHECPICMNAEANAILPCQHQICISCLTQWTEKQELANPVLNTLLRQYHPNSGHIAPEEITCPICRATISSDFLYETLVENMSNLNKIKFHASQLTHGFMNGLSFGVFCKNIIRWWNLHYLEKSAELGNEIYSTFLSLPIFLIVNKHLFRDFNQFNNMNDNIEAYISYIRQFIFINRLIQTRMMLKTKNKSLIKKTLHINLLGPSLECTNYIISYLNKGYAFKLAERTKLPTGLKTIGLGLGLYCTNKIYNTYDRWGSQIMSRFRMA